MLTSVINNPVLLFGSKQPRFLLMQPPQRFVFCVQTSGYVFFPPSQGQNITTCRPFPSSFLSPTTNCTICLLSHTREKPVLTTVEEEFAPLIVSTVKMPFYANALSVWRTCAAAHTDLGWRQGLSKSL